MRNSAAALVAVLTIIFTAPAYALVSLHGLQPMGVIGLSLAGVGGWLIASAFLLVFGAIAFRFLKAR